MSENKTNTIILNGKEISWNYTICPCLECEIYLNKQKSNDSIKYDGEDKACRTARCTYNHQLAKDIANDVFFMMNNRHCKNCDTWTPKEDLKYSHICPNCGNDL